MNQQSWTFTLITIRGIPIRLHLSFLVFLAALVVPGADSLYDAAVELLFLIGIFSCIALHELGHALTASWYGIKTRDIVIYPFGGIASITKSPSPQGELLIAIAGPLVNVLIAVVIFFTFNYATLILGASIPGRLLIANLFLAIFNMIPAIPMDGGRVLRALMTLANFKNATLISTRISQVISLGFIALALYWGRIDLLLVGVVVFIGALQEQVQTQASQAIRGHTVADAMIEASRLQTLSHGTTLADALLTALRSLQEYFPVVYNGQVRGIVAKDQLIQFASGNGENAYIQEITLREFPVVAPEQNLSGLLNLNQGDLDCPYFIVQDPQGNFLGMLLRDKILEFILIDELKRRMDNSRTVDESTVP